MLTKNAKNLLLYGLMKSYSTESGNPTPSSTFKLTNTEGTERTAGGSHLVIFGFINALNHTSTSGSTATTYIKCGTGTTAPTENDYNLEAEAADLSCDLAATSIGSNDAKIYTVTFSNTSTNDITVTEIGFFVNDYYKYDTDIYDKFLLDRIVLDTPITIPAGESKPITYEIGF